MSDNDTADLGIDGLTDAQEIGVGGFATVFRAYQSAFRRTVAVKVLATLNLDDAARERFERECQAMGALSDHPNIVTVYGAGFTTGQQSRPYLVMAYLAGGSLAERIAQSGPLPWQDATLYGVHLAGALETAHRAQIVHRDIKPANVLMSAFGDALLTDFGIARISGGHETRSGVITASMHHAPPEVIDGQRPTVVGDVYSLASTVYELILGHPSFEVAGDEGMVPMIRRILTEPPPDLRAYHVPDSVCRVLERAMAKDPLQRQQSALEFGRDMQAARRGVGLEGGKLTVPSDVVGVEPGDGGIAFVAAPSMVLCQVCHAQLTPGADVCGSCGTAVGTFPVTTGAVAAPGAYAPMPGAAPYATGPVPPPAPTSGSKGKLLVGAVIAVLVLVLGGLGVVLLSGGGSGEVADGPTTTLEGDSPTTTDEATTSTTEEEAATTTVPSDYTPAVEQNFVNACVGGGGATRPLCKCVFDGIRSTIPFDRFLEIEADVRQSQQMTDPQLTQIIVDCRTATAGGGGAPA